MIQSRGAVCASADNAAAESFHTSLKRETLQGARRWPEENRLRSPVVLSTCLTFTRGARTLADPAEVVTLRGW